MPYSLDLVLSDLRDLKEDTRSFAKTCRRTGVSEYDSLAAELHGLLDAVVDVSIALYRPEFRTRTDADQIINDIATSVQSGFANLRLLQPLLPSSSSRPSSPGDRLQIQNIGNRINKQTVSMQKKLDILGGREDWSGISPPLPQVPLPKVPQPKVPSPKGKDTLKVSTKNVSFGSSTGSNGSRSAPPSPYQTVVEEVPDDGEDEENHNVRHYHVDPPLFPSEDSGPIPEAPTPPKLLIRSPTDPNGFAPEAIQVNIDNIARNDAPSPAEASDASRNMHASPKNGLKDTPIDSSTGSLTNTKKQSQSKEEIEAEIQRLEAEYSRLSNGSESSRSHSRNSHSVEISNVSPSGSGTLQPHPNRQRASTTSDAGRQRPSSSRTQSSEDEPDRYPRPGRGSYTSPRYSPRAGNSPLSIPLGSSPRTRDRNGGSRRESRESIYGPDPHKSLPVVLESSRHRDGPGIGRFAGIRASWAYTEDQPLFPDPPTGPRGAHDRGGDFELFGGNTAQAHPKSPPAKTDDVPPGITQKQLPVSLEDLCNGASKRVRFRRRVPDSRGMRLIEEEMILDVPIYKGLKPGSRVKFRGEGDYVEWTGQRGDLWFFLVEKDHGVFTRKNLDLHTTVEIPLCDALCGWSKSVTSICGKQVRVSHPGPTPNGWREAYAGLGMPKYKNPAEGGDMERGDLVVEVKFVWPGRIEEWQKELLRQALGGSARVVS